MDYFLGGCARQFGFMVRGLRLVEPKLKALRIPFFFLQGKPQETIPELAERCGARLVVMDYLPLRIAQEWKQGVRASLFTLGSPGAPSFVGYGEAQLRLGGGGRAQRRARLGDERQARVRGLHYSAQDPCKAP